MLSVSFLWERLTNLTSPAIIRTKTGGPKHFIFSSRTKNFRIFSTSFHGQAAFKGELVAILMKALFAHSALLSSWPAHPTVALLWWCHWKTSTHLSPTGTNQGNREKHSKCMTDSSLVCYCLSFLKSCAFLLFSDFSFLPWFLRCRIHFFLESGGQARGAFRIFFSSASNWKKN